MVPAELLYRNDLLTIPKYNHIIGSSFWRISIIRKARPAGSAYRYWSFQRESALIRHCKISIIYIQSHLN